MTATNHALTGALIGLTIGSPVIALPLALLSHFVCDSLPHFGPGKQHKNRWIASNTFRTLLFADILLCIGLVAILSVWHPQHWLLASECAFLATAPDFIWLPKFIRARRELPVSNRPNRLAAFSSRIQWFERPIGSVVEVAWAIGGVSLITAFLLSA